MKAAKIFSIFILIAMVSVFIPSFALAGGAGIEPGGGCEAPEEGMKAKYDGPPYIGDCDLWFVEEPPGDSGVYIECDSLSRAGNSGCNANIPDSFIANMVIAEWENLKANHLRLSCFENTENFFDCHEVDELFEVIAVGGLKWNENGTATAQFVIMPVIFTY